MGTAVDTQHAAHADPTPVRPRAIVVRALPPVTVVAALLAMLIATDTAVLDIARYATYFGLAVALPGTLIYRALRRTPHSLVDDLAMGTALGLVLEIAVLILAWAVHVPALRWLWPALVAVTFVAVPSLRGHWRPAGYQRVPLAWAWAVASVVVFFVGYLTVVFLRPNQPVPTRGPQLYLIDELYFLGLIGEAKHHFPLTTPSVAGEPLPYHWFAFAHMATASTLSGVDAPVVMFRLALPAIAVVAVVLLAVAGWRVSGRPWVGAVATALTFAIGELVVGAGDVPGTIMAYFSWTSLSVLYGTVMTIPLIVAVADRLRGSEKAVAPLGGPAWILLGLFGLGAPGGKSTILPVTVAGVGLVCLVQLVRRRLTREPWLIVGILVVAQVVAAGALYHFETQSVGLGPLTILQRYLPGTYHRPWWKDLAVATFALGGYVLCLCTRLAGIPVLARLRGRTWGDTEWFLLGAVTSGAAAALLLWHTSWSQHFFMIAGWPAGAILSAMGMVELVERRQLDTRTVSWIAAAALTTAAVLGVALVPRGPATAPAGPAYHMLYPVYEAALAVVAIGALAAIVLFIASRRYQRLRGTASVAVLCLLLGAGLPRLVWDARRNANAGTGFHLQVTPEQATAARWLRAHSDADDLLATNAHKVTPNPPPDWSLSYWLTAFTERRVLVESWGYTTHATRDSAANHRLGPPSTFWDPDLLEANDSAILASTPERVQWLRDHKVRWIVVDRRFGRESPSLGALAALRWQGTDIAIYELPR